MKRFTKCLFTLMFIVTAVFGSLSPVTAEESEPKKILCIGDSITQGRGGDTPEYTYRYPLWKKLIDYSANAEFIGDINVGFESTPTYADYKGQTFNNKHHARWGWTIQGIDEDLTEPLKLAENIPDIAIIYLGTNNEVEHEPYDAKTEAMRSLIAKVRGANPNVTIILGEPFQEWMYDLAIMYRKLAAELTTPQSPIVTVRRPNDWFSPAGSDESCTLDSVHTSQRGDKMLADEIFPALAPFIGITPEPVIKSADTRTIKGWAIGGTVSVYMTVGKGSKLIGTEKVAKKSWALTLKTPLAPGTVLYAKNTYNKIPSNFSKQFKITKVAKPLLNKVKPGATSITGTAQKGAKVTVKVGKKAYKAVKCASNGKFKVKVAKIKKGSKITCSATYGKYKSANATLKAK